MFCFLKTSVLPNKCSFLKKCLSFFLLKIKTLQTLQKISEAFTQNPTRNSELSKKTRVHLRLFHFSF